MAYYRRMNHAGTENKIGLAYYEAHYHDKVTCDACAKAGAVPFILNLRDGIPEQSRPWCWAPHYGDDCEQCGKPC
jgi:hypothetical protein